MRLFIGIELPESISTRLELMGGGIPGARWEPAEKLHVTVRFLGEVDHGRARRLEDALEGIDLPPFSLSVHGVGVFPPRGVPRILWAGVDDPKPVSELHEAVERVVGPVGFEPEHRKYHPHVTLARLKRPPVARVAEFVAQHALLATEPFEVDHFTLYSSVLNPRGSKYRVEARFELQGRA
jgi:2'-5' RNA ligase